MEKDMSRIIDLEAYRAELQQKIKAIDVLLGRDSNGNGKLVRRTGITKSRSQVKRRMPAAARAKLATIARARWKKAKAAGRAAL